MDQDSFDLFIAGQSLLHYYQCQYVQIKLYSFKIQVTFQVSRINFSALLLNETVRHIYKQFQILELTFLKNRKALT